MDTYEKTKITTEIVARLVNAYLLIPFFLWLFYVHFHNRFPVLPDIYLWEFLVGNLLFNLAK